MDITADDLDIPEHADDDEAAAIAAAISAHLARLERAETSDEDGSTGWAGCRWSFAGRLSAVFDQPARVPDRVPEDAWSASGRRDRM